MSLQKIIQDDEYLSLLQGQIKGKKVIVGVSGGVDSAVTLALVKEMGAEVTGAFMKAWYPDFVTCSWKEDRESAMKTCAFLKVPFKEYDFSEVYKSGVVDYMIEEYKKGRTPNPDIMCNSEVKFGAFLSKIKLDGFEYMATGHYARREMTSEDKGIYISTDTLKDQTYFLWGIESVTIPSILFPLGSLEKKQVREIAKKLNLPPAGRPDSQGICFLGEINMDDFLSHYIQSKKGDVLNVEGEVIGYHEGVLPLTIGQATGFTITKKDSYKNKVYILSKNIIDNSITVGSINEKIDKDYNKLNNDETLLELESLNMIDTLHITDNLSIRYRHRGDMVKVKNINSDINSKNMNVVIDGSHQISPGQSIVFYQDKQLIGGGILI